MSAEPTELDFLEATLEVLDMLKTAIEQNPNPSSSADVADNDSQEET